MVRLGQLLLNHLVNQADLLEAFLDFVLLLLALALHRVWNVEDVGHGSVQTIKQATRLAACVLVRPTVAREHRGELLLRRLLFDRRVFDKLVHYNVFMPRRSCLGGLLDLLLVLLSRRVTGRKGQQASVLVVFLARVRVDQLVAVDLFTVR